MIYGTKGAHSFSFDESIHIHKKNGEPYGLLCRRQNHEAYPRAPPRLVDVGFVDESERG